MNKKRAFIFSVIFWLIFIGLFVGVRFVGTGYQHFFLDSNWKILTAWVIASLIFAIVFWLGLILENNPKIRIKSYYKLILLKAGFVLISLLFFTFFVLISGIVMGKPIIQALAEYRAWMLSPLMMVSLLYVMAATIFISFIWQMAIKIGPNVLVNLMLGKYHVPREEDRVFMFLDMKSSTTIAEKIGHIKFSQLIQDCFADLTDSAVLHKVEIYQYVGDEAVLTWNIDNASRRNNCLHAYYDFEKSLAAKKDYYLNKYDEFPEFKAGLNSGLVVVSEVGIIKREIAYLSDVLNTAARIQGKCNELNAKLLISDNVKAILVPDSALKFDDLGDFKLRGKQAEVRIYSVSKSIDS